MFNKEVLRRLMHSERNDPFNSYGEHVPTRTLHGGIRYKAHPTPEMDFQPDTLFTGEEMYEDIKPKRVASRGGRLVGGLGCREYGDMVSSLEGGSIKSIGKSLKKGLKQVGKVVAPIAKDVVMPVVKDFATKQGRKLLEQQLAKFAVKDVLPAAEEAAPLLLAAGRKKSGGRMSGGAMDKRSARAVLVKKIMREHGCSLPMASKYIKENGLQY
jgi:hypothetical protein